jgi:hypothetical protein
MEFKSVGMITPNIWKNKMFETTNQYIPICGFELNGGSLKLALLLWKMMRQHWNFAGCWNIQPKNDS